MTIALVLLVALVACGGGGYSPWATLALELGAAGLAFVAIARALGGGDVELLRARHRAWKRLSFPSRHPFIARCLRVASFGKWGGTRATTEVEILLPGERGGESVEIDLARELFVLGHPFRRTGFGPPLVLLTSWIALSIVPLSNGVVALLSPMGAGLRGDARSLVGVEVAPAAPWSLAPFLTARSLWMWFAILTLFVLSVAIARRRRSAENLALALLLLGVASGVYGLGVWFEELGGAYGIANEALRARGSFGNPNHYAAFQSMLVLAGLGSLAWLRSGGAETATPSPRRSGELWNQRALAAIAGLGLSLSGLALVLTLSRSGLASCLAGGAVFLALTDVRRSSLRGYAALGVAILGLTVWIGIEPLVGRLAQLDDQWAVEGTRIELWADTLPAVADFWRTGSGLSTFRYVGAAYRSFGGRRFYSWAHNDYLQLAIELGIPGLLLLSWLGAAFVRAARKVREDLADAPPLRNLHAGFVAAIAAVALHSATDFSLHLPANLALLAVLVGGAVGMTSGDARKRATGAGSPRSRRRPW